MNDEKLEKKLEGMLRAVRADAEPALMTRARAAIEARRHRPWLVRWAMQPLALGASLAIFVASAGLSFLLLSSDAASSSSGASTLIESLLEERGIDDSVAPAASPATPGAGADSGGVR